LVSVRSVSLLFAVGNLTRLAYKAE